MIEEAQNEAPVCPEIELFSENYFAPLDLTRVFPSQGPLEIDIGCGDGGFIAAIEVAQGKRLTMVAVDAMTGRILSVQKPPR